jgi:acyl-CoA synthetase (AMP-forming)/AMP-acid ligase II
MGDLLARGLEAAPGAEFRVHSAVRPWAGTFRDVEQVGQKWPEELHALADFPRTPSGKVQKFLLRREIAARQSGE